jgi:UDP-2,3-diacylglucosamine pyrophosphatase LpxH
MSKREVDVVVLSDVHLGTYGCHATELLRYLRSIRPRMLVLNGDIIDIWQFSKRYWPATHMMVVRELLTFMSQEIPVYYIPGNHDEMLRRFNGFEVGSLHITNKLSVKIDGQRVWIFHGDVFDVVMKHSKWLARLGAIGYDMLILINRVVNFCSEKMGRSRISLSKRVKDSVKSAVKFVNNFETTVCDIAAENDFDYVICGHIHQPEIKTVNTAQKHVVYMNSGDWIENLTALEFHDHGWRIYRYADDYVAQAIDIDKKQRKSASSKELMATLLREMNMMKEATGMKDQPVNTNSEAA